MDMQQYTNPYRKLLSFFLLFCFVGLSAAHAAITFTITPSTYKEVGVTYSQTTTATGGVAPYTYSVAAGALPAGTSLNSSTGVVSGTPTTAGAFSYRIKAVDAVSATATTTNITGTILAALTLTSTPSAVTQTTLTYSQANTAAGGTTPRTFSITAGALPAGTSLNITSGLVSGTPTVIGPFSYSVTVTDAAGATATKSLSGTIFTRLAVSFTASAIKEVGAPYLQQTTGSNGSGAYVYSIFSGTLPPGTTLNTSTGLVSGTPTTSGTFSYRISVKDSQNVTATTGTITSVIAPQLVLTSTSSTFAQVGASYSQSNVATGGTTPYVYSIIAGTLPPGTSLNTSTGLVSGTPTTAGPYQYTVQVKDAQTVTRTQTISTNINAALSLLSTNSTVTSVGANYAQVNQGQNGSGTYTQYAVTSGTLPAGTSLNASTGLVSGALTTVQTFTYQITVTDSAGKTASQTISGSIGAELALTSSLSTISQVNVNYLQTNTGSGGVSPYQYSLTGGALPAGTTLNPATGNVSGTPTTAGSFNYAITVTDSQNVTAQLTISGSIDQPLLLTSQFSSVNQVGQAYSQTNTGSGGVAPYVYSISAGSVPPGTSLNSSGTVTGTPTTPGNYTYTVTVTDANNTTDSETLAVSLAAGLTLNSLSSSYTQVDALYSQPNIAEGGTQPYTYAVTAGNLPDNTILNSSTGIISGIPANSGAFNYTITVTDNVGATAQQTITGNIDELLLLNTNLSPVAAVGKIYSQTNQATGGLAPYIYSYTGTLPNGVSLDTSTGLVSGTPTQAGNFQYTISVQDAQNFFARQTIKTTIDTPIILTSTSSSAHEVNLLYSQTNIASGGDGLYTYQIILGTLPPGTQLDTQSGLVYGIPTTPGFYQYTVQVTDGQGLSAHQVITTTIEERLILISVSSPLSELGQPYNQTNTGAGGSLPYTYSLVSGVLPDGTVLNADGSVTGTPTAPGMFAYTIQVEDQNGATATQETITQVQTGVQLISDPSSVLDVGGFYTQTNHAVGGTAPYQYNLTSGTLPTGTNLDVLTGDVTGTLTTAGEFTYEVTATDSNGITASQTITAHISAIPIPARPDPTEDPTVISLISAQAFAAIELNQLQIDQTHDHLIKLHNDTRDETSEGKIFNWDQTFQTFLPQVAQGQLSFNENLFSNAFWVFWISGVLDYASLMPDNTAETQHLHTSSVTLGWDALVHPQLIFGLSAGYGVQDNELDSFGSENNATNSSISSYFSYEPVEHWFIDFLVGYSQFDNDSSRWSTTDILFLDSDRDGHAIYTSISFNHSMNLSGLILEPYFRSDLIFAHFDPAEESGSNMALSYEEMDLDTESASIGLVSYFDFPIETGFIRPLGTLEYAHVFGGDISQDIYYADLGTNSVIYNLGIAPIPENNGSLGLGVSYIRKSGAQIGIEWTGTIGSQDYRSNQIGLAFISSF